MKPLPHSKNGELTTRLCVVLIALALVVVMAACTTGPATPVATTAPTATVSPTVQPEPTEAAGASDGSIAGVAEGMATAVIARTPEPTPTPGIIDKGVDTVTDVVGLADRSFLGLPADDWLEAVVAILIILIGFVVIRLFLRLLKWLLNRSGLKRGNAFYYSISRELQWLMMLFVVRLALFRLDFLSDSLRTILADLFFFLGFLLIIEIVFKLINLVINNYEDSLDPDDRHRLTPMLMSVRRVVQIIVLILFVSIGLSHFGISSNVLSATIILVGLIIALGAKDVIADAISGFIILLDQPFRVDDAIYIEELRRRGEVLEIGTRTTRIRTEDNREVIIPNSMIGKSEVINYSYPDPSYRLETDLGIPYDADMDQVRRVLTAAVRGVEGVMPEKPVAVLFRAYGDYARLIGVRWWIVSYEQEWTMTDKVNQAMNDALNNAGIEIPFPHYDLNLLNQGGKGSDTSPAPLANSQTSTNS